MKNIFTISMIIFLFSLVYSLSEPAVNINILSVNNVISISPVSLPTNFLPTYEYTSNIQVNWTIPYSALQHINSNNVTIYVKAIIVQDPEQNNSVYFKDGINKLNTSYVVLTCHIKNTECTANSVLSRNISFFVRSNSDQNISATIYLLASFKPFEDFLPIYQKSIELQKELDEITNSLNTSNSSLDNLINETKSQISAFQVEDAKSNLEEIKVMTGYNDPNFLFNFNLDGVERYLQFIFGFISEDIQYSIALWLAILILISLLILKIRKVGKIGLILITIAVIICSFLKIISPLLLIVVDVVVILLLLYIMSFRRQAFTRKRFRNKDEYEDYEYNKLFSKSKK